MSSDLPCAKAPVHICVTGQEQSDALPKALPPQGFVWHPLAIALSCLLRVSPGRLLSVCNPSVGAWLDSIKSQCASKRMRHPWLPPYASIRPMGPDLSRPLPLSSFPSLCAQPRPFYLLRHSWLVSARGHCCSLCPRIFRGSLYGIYVLNRSISSETSPPQRDQGLSIYLLSAYIPHPSGHPFLGAPCLIFPITFCQKYYL